MGVKDDGVDVGDALLVAGYDAAAANADDARLPLLNQLGEAVLASTSPWRVRQLVARTGARDVPSRDNVRRELDALFHRPASARILVLAARLTQTIEGLALVCAPTLGGFREDDSVPLEWLAIRLRRAADIPTAIVAAIPGIRSHASACLDILGTAAAEHVIVIDAGDPVENLRGLIDALRGEAIDLATDTVTPRSLGDYLSRWLGKAAIQPSSSTRTLLTPRHRAHADLARPASRRPAAGADELLDAVLPGRFRVVSELGRGTFSVVYRAHQELVDRPVAIKVLPARHGIDAIRRFALEIRAVGGLDHRNVVRVLHADTTHDGRMFVAMELLSGPTLEQLLTDGPLPPARALGLTRQLIAGLAAAHAAGIIHADVKPANAVVVDGNDPRLVLLDFGLASLRADGASRALGGTPGFMAPEQLRGECIDASVDLYAAALVALTLVAGSLPRTEADRARALAAFVDDRVRAALAKALANDPAARFASAVEMTAALAEEPHGQRIDYRIERQRHDDFVGRDALLARLDQLLLADPIDRWVVVIGGPGMGKSAVLATWLSRREAAGAVIPHHFIRRGEYDWDDPAKLVGSLVAQLDERFPDQREPAADAQHHPAARLAKTLTRLSASVLVPRGERLVVLIDGLDEYDPPPATPTGDPLAAFLPHALPAGVSFLCASRPRHPYLSVLEARDGELVRIDLDDPDAAADNDATVRGFWEPAASPLGLDAAFVDAAVARAGGNLQYAVTLRKHVAGLSAGQRRVEAIPRGLAALLGKLWDRISTYSIAVHGLGILCAAREALTLDELGLAAGWTDTAQRQAFMRGASELLVETRRTDGQAEYRPHHDAIRAHVASMIGAAALRGHHTALARQLATWPAPTDPTARRYALRHALVHRVEAGDWVEAWRLAADMGFLEAKCRELGAHEAEADVARASERCRTSEDEAIGRRFDDLTRALGRESHWLRDAPGATAALVWNRLRRLGWSVEDLDERLRIPARVTFLRVRHSAPRESPALVRTLIEHTRSVNACAVTPDGRRVISASKDETLKIWDLHTGRVLATLVGHAGPVTACAVTTDGHRVLSASEDQTLKIWDLDTDRVLATLQGHTGAVTACAVTPDQRRLISASSDQTLKVWDLHIGCVLATLYGHTDRVTACAVMPDGGRMVSGSLDRTLKIWDLDTGRVLSTLEGHTDRVSACAVTPDGRRVISASEDRTLKVWDLGGDSVPATLRGHNFWVTACAVTPDDRRVISAARDHTLKVWSPDSAGTLAATEGIAGWIYACAVTIDGRRVVSASKDKTIKIWDIDGGRILATCEGHADQVHACAVAPDGKRVVSASRDHTLKVWDLDTGRALATFEGHAGWVNGCAVTPDGERVVSASSDHTLKVWDLDTGRVLATFEGHADLVVSCAVTPDGRRAVSASKDRRLKVWDLDTGRVLTTLEGHPEALTACAVMDDGRRAVSASLDHSLRVWDLDSGVLLATLRGHLREVLGCAVTRDGRCVVSTSIDRTVKVWDLDTYGCVLTHRGDAPYIAVAASATVVVAGDFAGTLWFLDWPLTMAPPIQPLASPLRSSSKIAIRL